MANNETKTAFCKNEYDTLHTVILCEPKHMEIQEVINETQRRYKQENIDITKAMEEHRQFTEILVQNGVNIVLLPSVRQFPEQVFTRDIGFTIGGTLFIGEMATDIRHGEEELLAKHLKERNIPFKTLSKGSIEGGDVIVDGLTVYVGVSSRTDEDAIAELEAALPDRYKVIPIEFDARYLHLDCVFNLLSDKDALIFPGAIKQQSVNLLNGRYDLIEVSEQEQFTLGTNVLSIGEGKVFSLPVNQMVNHELSARGYTVIETDFSEIIKSGGSLRCCTLPLKRG